jgi:hypothetical protein
MSIILPILSSSPTIGTFLLNTTASETKIRLKLVLYLPAYPLRLHLNERDHQLFQQPLCSSELMCVINAGWLARDSTPPKDSAINTCNFSKNAIASCFAPKQNQRPFRQTHSFAFSYFMKRMGFLENRLFYFGCVQISSNFSPFSQCLAYVNAVFDSLRTK